MDSEIYLGRQLRSSKPEVGFFLADKAKAASVHFSPSIDRGEEDLKKVTEPSAPDLTFSLENPIFSAVKHKVQGAETPEVLYHKSSTPKPHKNTESLNESWYPKLDDLGAESGLQFKPQKLSFSTEKFHCR